MVARKRRWWREVPKGKLYKVPNGEIICTDAVSFLGGIQPEVADIVFVDPPFNLGKRYGPNRGSSDLLDDEEYFSYLSAVLELCVLAMKPGAALYLYHIPRWAIRFAPVLATRLEFRHWIAISMKNGFVRGPSLYPAHYALLYFTKGKPRNFSRPKVEPLRCRHCNEYVKDYGGYKRFVKEGINLSDIWEDISPVRHKKYKLRASNQLPLEIPRRAIQISGAPGDTLLDPFAGAGTALLAAKEAGMQVLACDRVQEYCDLMATLLRSPSCCLNPPEASQCNRAQ